MKKVDFVTLLMCTAGGVLFALGMCMCLLEEWGAFSQGIIAGMAGMVILFAAWMIRRRMLGKAPIVITKKAVGIALLAAAGLLLLGVGMCMTMLWEGLLLWGIVIGLAGIMLLLCLIPVCAGLK